VEMKISKMTYFISIFKSNDRKARQFISKENEKYWNQCTH
jgi:hypothetical protein